MNRSTSVMHSIVLPFPSICVLWLCYSTCSGIRFVIRSLEIWFLVSCSLERCRLTFCRPVHYVLFAILISEFARNARMRGRRVCFVASSFLLHRSSSESPAVVSILPALKLSYRSFRIEQWSAMWGTRKHQSKRNRGTARTLNRLWSSHPTEIRPRIEVLACQKQTRSSH
jgi:hypothetical protein